MFFAKELEKQDPDGITTYSEGFDYYQRREYEKALAIFQALLSTYPMSKDLWHAYGSCLQMLKQYEEALPAFAVEALFDPLDPYPHLHAAECFLALEDYEQMLKAFEQIKAIPNALLDDQLKQRIDSIL